MLRLLHSIFLSSSGKTAKLDEALIERATERVVDGTDSRLRAVVGYRKKLRSAVEHAVEYVIDLVDDLPPAVELSKRQYGVDPYLRAFFASANRLQEIVSSSQTIRSYVTHGTLPATNIVYAGLGVQREERKTLGMDLVRDQVRRDVAQVVVNFCNHGIKAVSDDETITRREIKKLCFDSLIRTALKRLISERTKRDELAQERQLLRRKQQALADSCWGLESVLDREEFKPHETVSVEKRIVAIETELSQINTKVGSLNDHLGLVASTLNEPQEHLRMDTISLTLDRMGVKIPEGSHSSVNTLSLNEITIGEGRRVIVLVVAIPWDEIQQPPSDPLKEASRYL